MGLLGVGVGRGDQVEGRIEQGQAGDSIDSTLNPRETGTSEPSRVSVQKGPSKSILLQLRVEETHPKASTK